MQVLVLLWFATLLILLQQYGFAAVLLLGFTAYFVTRQRQDEHHSYRLRGSALQEDGKTIDLTVFKGFELQELPDNTEDHLSAALILVPERYFGLGRTIYLPNRLEDAEAIIEALPTRLIMTNDGVIDQVNRVLNRLARWLRIV
ncbi:hypothetical protein BIU82_00170 [Arthrobacter sp. SW1]|nr:hypothetical protein BIU82_00170 [Arthrobacter sp. SW1]